MFKTAYNNTRQKLEFLEDDGMTEQKHKDDTDINVLLSRFDRRHALEFRSDNVGHFGFADAVTFQDAMYIVAKGNSMFEEMPSHLRQKFENNPAKFLSFVQNPENAEKMVKLGLARTPEDIPSKVTQEEVFRVIRDVVKEAGASEGGSAAETP